MQVVGTGLGYGLVVLLCLVGLVLSCLSISGTWLVVVAAIVAGLLQGWCAALFWTVTVFVLLGAGVEVIEAVAGGWGVKSKGGSNLAGVMAVVGGLLGMLLGGLIPVPVIGSLLGMIIGSFVLVYLVERRRMAVNKAADIAWGAVIARVLVILLKSMVTLGMVVFLVWRVLC